MFKAEKVPLQGGRDASVAAAIAGGIQALQEHGRTRGTLVDDEQRVCIRGALNVAIAGHAHGGTNGNGVVLRVAAEKAIAEAAGATSVPVFNDDKATSDAQVMSAMNEALLNVTPVPSVVPVEFMRETV